MARSRQVTSRLAAAQHLRDLARPRRVRDRIGREYAQPLDVEALARGVNMSAGHFSRQFRRCCVVATSENQTYCSKLVESGDAEGDREGGPAQHMETG